MKKPVFVTGATGRLGRRFVAQALGKGYSVTALVRDGKKAERVFGKKRVKLVRGDLSSIPLHSLRAALRGHDVVHLAAAVNFYVSAEKLWDDNVEATRTMVRAAEAERVARFVHMSSTGIYHHPSYLPIDERQPPSPMAGYGVTKLEAEKIVRASGLDYVMIRAPAIYGPSFDEGFTDVMDLVASGKMVILGEGKNRVPLIHVEDVVQALMLALENRHVHRESFIVTSGEDISQEECLRLLAEELHVQPPSKHVPVPVAYGMVAYDALRGLFTGKRKIRKLYVDFLAEDRVFDTSKARRDLGYRPRMTLRQGVREYLASSGKKFRP